LSAAVERNAVQDSPKYAMGFQSFNAKLLPHRQNWRASVVRKGTGKPLENKKTSKISFSMRWRGQGAREKIRVVLHMTT